MRIASSCALSALLLAVLGCIDSEPRARDAGDVGDGADGAGDTPSPDGGGDTPSEVAPGKCEQVACPAIAAPCQENTCDPETGQCALRALPGGSECDDGNACTTGDACGDGAKAGQCVSGVATVCPDLGQCTEGGACNPFTGICDSVPRPDGENCDDAPALGGEGMSLGVCAVGTCRRLPALWLGGSHGCVIMWDGAVRCWGRNDDGQLGLGHEQDVGSGLGPSVAESDALALSNVTALGLGNAQTCAISDGALRCWGANGSGALGYGDLTSRGGTSATTPDHLDPVALGAGFIPVAVGTTQDATCALSREGGVKCWGASPMCYPGVGAVGVPDAPSIADMGLVELASPGGDFPVEVLVQGSDNACAISRGDLRCWGLRSFYGPIGDDETPGSAPTVNTGWLAESVSTLNRHSCAVSTVGAVYCWGSNTYGQLGTGVASGVSSLAGPLVLGAGNVARRVAAGTNHSCLLLADGSVRCWGSNASGQLGRGDDAEVYAPVFDATVDLGGPAVDIAAGAAFTCAVMRDGAVRCWGDGTNGRLGNDDSVIIGDQAGEMPPAAIRF